jgi:uncharacterized membrane protein YqjE
VGLATDRQTRAGGESLAAGPFDALKGLGRTAVDILHTRFDLLVTEIAEEQSRLAELFLYAAAALLCLLLAAIVVAVLVLASLWDTPYRLLATGLMAGLLAAAGAACAVIFARKARAKPRLFSASLDELGADLERLR